MLINVEVAKFYLFSQTTLFINFRVATPFSVAKLVMERSQHSILVGEGAQQFAKEHGIPVLSNELLQTESSTKAYKVFQCFSSLRAKFKIDVLAKYILF